MKIAAPRGTRDILPDETGRWQQLESVLRDTAARFGYREIRFPAFEHTELFQRGIGDTTDVVQKEMYTFEDKGGRSLTLRPEGTASAVRALIEHGLHVQPMPLKTYYIVPNFRYENPQKGRLRQHHQFGVECFGTAHPAADAEVIALADSFMKELGLQDIALRLNSIGCPDCRPNLHAALQTHLAGHSADLCADCRDRMERNPLRVLDCKNAKCHDIAANAPHSIDHLCPDCQEHMDTVRAILDGMDIPYTIDPFLVRGLDYYSRTVFEFSTGCIGTQSTICGGGRYDGLAESLGGPKLPALGFGCGLERLLMVLEAQQTGFSPETRCDVYIASIASQEQTAEQAAIALCHKLRRMGLRAETDICGRGLKAQMKYADKLGARYTLVIGEDELQKKQITLREMATGESHPGILDPSFLKSVIKQL